MLVHPSLVAITMSLVRGEPIAPLAGGRKAEAIVPASEPDGRYPTIARREAPNFAASGCRHKDR